MKRNLLYGGIVAAGLLLGNDVASAVIDDHTQLGRAPHWKIIVADKPDAERISEVYATIGPSLPPESDSTQYADMHSFSLDRRSIGDRVETESGSGLIARAWGNEGVRYGAKGLGVLALGLIGMEIRKGRRNYTAVDDFLNIR